MAETLPSKLRRQASGSRESRDTAALLREGADAIDMLLAQMADLVDQRERLRQALQDTQAELREMADLISEGDRPDEH